TIPIFDQAPSSIPAHNVETATTIETIVSLHYPNVDDENPVRIIPGPGEEFVMPTQEYIRKVVEDVGNIKNFLKNGKLNQVIAIIKSCSPNALGDLTLTLKDLPGTLYGTIHYKVLVEEGYGQDITPKASLLLHNVLVFTPKPSIHYLNITRRNLVKVFHKDTIIRNGSSVEILEYFKTAIEIGMKYLRRLLIILGKNYFVLKIKWSANTRELAKVWKINWKVDTGELKGCLDDGSKEKKAVLDGSYRLFLWSYFHEA
nr:hypothetical protein [Tanacetum cinerariifolium]